MRRVKRAQILLACDRGTPDAEVAQNPGCGTSTVHRVKKPCVEEGLEATLNEKPRPGRERRLTGREEAILVAVACSNPPTGQARWTLKLLAAELVQFIEHENISAATVGRRLAEKEIKPWQKKMWCIPQVDAEFVANTSWRGAKVTSRRTNLDFAQYMRDLADIHYPPADRIRVVRDNLSTHRAKNLYEAFPADEVRRILGRLKLHYTPKHASWLNMAEIEIGVLGSQCLPRRIPSQDDLTVQVQAWTQARNRTDTRINWMFDFSQAREKLGRSCPQPAMDSAAAVA